MLTFNTFNLTSEQINRIPEYRHKWQQIALSKEPINRDRATTAVNNAYEFLNLSQPNIIFFSHPGNAIDYINNEINNSWGNLEGSVLGSTLAAKFLERLLGKIRTEIKPETIQQLGRRLDEGLAKSIGKEIFTRLDFTEINSLFLAHMKSSMNRSISESMQSDDLFKNISKIWLDFTVSYTYLQNKIFTPLTVPIYSQFINFIGGEQAETINDSLLEMGGSFFAGEFINKQEPKQQLPTIEGGAYFINVIVPSVAVDFAYYIDYCHSVLNCPLDRDKWNIFQDLITTCGWIFPYEKTVLVCGA